jgi:hypothetical protein
MVRLKNVEDTLVFSVDCWSVKERLSVKYNRVSLLVEDAAPVNVKPRKVIVEGVWNVVLDPRLVTFIVDVEFCQEDVAEKNTLSVLESVIFEVVEFIPLHPKKDADGIAPLKFMVAPDIHNASVEETDKLVKSLVHVRFTPFMRIDVACRRREPGDVQ